MRWRHAAALAVTFATASYGVAAFQTTATTTYQERDFLTRIRRLTIEGRRAGEGYWSPDGKRLVFQSEREPGNPFYQIYTLDLGTADVKRISPGMGKTTCAFFRPGSDEILFSSTHHDPKSKQYQDEELAFADRQVDAAQGGEVLERHREAARLDLRRRHAQPFTAPAAMPRANHLPETK